MTYFYSIKQPNSLSCCEGDEADVLAVDTAAESSSMVTGRSDETPSCSATLLSGVRTIMMLLSGCSSRT